MLSLGPAGRSKPLDMHFYEKLTAPIHNRTNEPFSLPTQPFPV